MVTVVCSGWFRINREGGQPDSHSKQQHEIAPHANGSRVHSLCFGRGTGLDQIEKPLTHKENRDDGRADFP